MIVDRGQFSWSAGIRSVADQCQTRWSKNGKVTCKKDGVMRRVLLVVCLSIAFVSAGSAAQWLNYKTPGVPRTRDGKPKLDAPAPRGVEGHPDLTGVWMHELTPVAEVRRLFGQDNR
jgi:hypothetical protein